MSWRGHPEPSFTEKLKAEKTDKVTSLSNSPYAKDICQKTHARCVGGLLEKITVRKNMQKRPSQLLGKQWKKLLFDDDEIG